MSLIAGIREPFAWKHRRTCGLTGEGERWARPQHGGELGNELLDFSVNLNPLAPPVPDATWLRWKHLAMQYPPATSDAISNRIAGALGTEARHTLVTNGGMEALQAGIALHPQQEVCIPAPCFSEYPFLAHQLNSRSKVFMVDPSDWWAPDAWLDRDYPAGSLVVLANPANPTGMRIPLERMKRAILSHRPKRLRWLVDEAFMGFAPGGFSESLSRSIGDLPEVTIVGSLTKLWSIPGLRLGYMVCGDPAFAATFRQRQLTWPINGIACAWADEFLHPEGQEQLLLRLQTIHRWRDSFQIALQKLPGIQPMPSDANFFLVALDKSLDLAALSFAMKQNGIAVRSCETIPGMETTAFWRIAVRTPEENDRFLAAWDKSFQTQSFSHPGRAGLQDPGPP